MERELSGIQGVEQGQWDCYPVEVSKYVPTDVVEAMVFNEAPVFPIDGQPPEVVTVQHDEQRPRNANIHAIGYDSEGDTVVASHCIRFPSSLARAIASFRNKTPNAHVSTELRRVDPFVAAQYGLFAKQQKATLQEAE